MMLANSLPSLSVPAEKLDKLPKDSPFMQAYQSSEPSLFSYYTGPSALAEFGSARELKQFIAKENCKTDMMAGGCDKKTNPYKPFQISSYGSNSAALDDAKSKVLKVASYIFIGIGIFAALILWFTMSRTISEGRRETAVFRAIGFKRSNITLVYVIYTLMLAVRIVIVSLVLGLIGVVILDRLFWVG